MANLFSNLTNSGLLGFGVNTALGLFGQSRSQAQSQAANQAFLSGTQPTNVAATFGQVATDPSGQNIVVGMTPEQEAERDRLLAASGIFESELQKRQDFDAELARERAGFDRRKQEAIDSAISTLRGQGRLGTEAGARELATLRERFEEQEQIMERNVKQRHFEERRKLFEDVRAGVTSRSTLRTEPIAAAELSLLGQQRNIDRFGEPLQTDKATAAATAAFFDNLTKGGQVGKSLTSFFQGLGKGPPPAGNIPPGGLGGPQSFTGNVGASGITKFNFTPRTLPQAGPSSALGSPTQISTAAPSIVPATQGVPVGPGGLGAGHGAFGGGAGAGAITTGVPLQGSLAGGGPFGPSIAAAKTAASGLGGALSGAIPHAVQSGLAAAGTTAATVGGLAGSASAVPFTAAAVPGVGLALAAMAFVGKFSSGMTPKNHAEGLAVSLSALGKQNSNMVLPGSGNTMSLQAIANLPMQILRAKGHDPQELIKLGAPPQLANLINHPLMLRTKNPGTPGGYITTGGGAGGTVVGNVLNGIGTPQFNLVMDTLRQMNAPGFANVQAQVNAHLAKKKQSAAVQLNRP